MSYRLESDEPLGTGLKRIVLEQIDQALEQLTEAPEGRDEGVHDARKRFKKIRAVLRLVRDEVGYDVYKSENVCYRDAGRRLSDVRDSNVHIETIDRLKEYYADQLAPEAFDGVRTNLVEAHKALKQRILDEENAMAEVAETIRQARQRVANWPIERQDFAAIKPGLKRVYKRGYKRMADAYAEPEPEKFHEWRKRVKYLWYHTRILQPIWPEVLDDLADQLHDLADYLGDDHDLVELRYTLRQHPELFEDEQEKQALLGLIKQRRTSYKGQAEPLGERIYAENPSDFVDRIESYWQAWQLQLAEAE